eukprot:scaffold96286_cov15-Tisochrysis_lutea.AAC.1
MLQQSASLHCHSCSSHCTSTARTVLLSWRGTLTQKRGRRRALQCASTQASQFAWHKVEQLQSRAECTLHNFCSLPNDIGSDCAFP